MVTIGCKFLCHNASMGFASQRSVSATIPLTSIYYPNLYRLLAVVLNQFSLMYHYQKHLGCRHIDPENIYETPAHGITCGHQGSLRLSQFRDV